MPKINEELENAKEQKWVAAFSYYPVSLDEQEKELIEVFEALGNVAK